MKLFSLKFGYTLSEVLLTIGLIGFLATMTLSTVGSSVQQRTRLAQFRTAYAKLTSALRSVTTDQGRVYKCYYDPSDDDIEMFGLSVEQRVGRKNDACVQLETEYLKALGAVRKCENAIVDGCVPNNYPTAGEGFKNYNYVRAYVLDNSMIFLVKQGSRPSNRYVNLFALDTNGRKGPNKWGQDIFPFEIKYTDVKRINGVSYVKAVDVLPPDKRVMPDSDYVTSSASRSTLDMIKESAGVR